MKRVNFVVLVVVLALWGVTSISRADVRDYVKKGYVIREEAEGLNDLQGVKFILLSPKIEQRKVEGRKKVFVINEHIENYYKKFVLFEKSGHLEKEIQITDEVRYFQDGGTTEVDCLWRGKAATLRFPHRLGINPSEQPPVIDLGNRVITLRRIVSRNGDGRIRNDDERWEQQANKEKRIKQAQALRNISNNEHWPLVIKSSFSYKRDEVFPAFQLPVKPYAKIASQDARALEAKLVKDLKAGAVQLKLNGKLLVKAYETVKKDDAYLESRVTLPVYAEYAFYEGKPAWFIVAAFAWDPAKMPNPGNLYMSQMKVLAISADGKKVLYKFP